MAEKKGYGKFLTLGLTALLTCNRAWGKISLSKISGKTALHQPLPGILEGPMAENMDYERDTITLMDEEGVEHEFEIVDTLEDNDTEYLALIPIFDDPQSSLDDDGELVILKVVYDEDEQEEFLEPILDDAEYERIADQFMDRLEEFFDFEE